MEEMCRVWYVEKGTEISKPSPGTTFPVPHMIINLEALQTPLFVGFYGKSLHRHGYLLTIGYWFNLQPLSPPQRLGHLGLNGQEAWMKTKNIWEMLSSKWPSLFSYKSQYCDLYLCPGRFSQKCGEDHSAHTGRLEGLGGNRNRANPEDQPSTHGWWKLAQICSCFSWLRGYHYEPCFTAFLSGVSFCLPLAS